MKCPKCGNENAKGAVCDKCGAALLARLSEDKPEVENMTTSLQPQDSPPILAQNQTNNQVDVGQIPQTLGTNLPGNLNQPFPVPTPEQIPSQPIPPTVQPSEVQTTPVPNQPLHPIPPAKSSHQVQSHTQELEDNSRQSQPSTFEIPADFRFSDEVDDDGSAEIEKLQVKVEEEEKSTKKPKKKNKKRIKRRIKKVLSRLITIGLIVFMIYYIIVHFIIPNNFTFGFFN